MFRVSCFEYYKFCIPIVSTTAAVATAAVRPTVALAIKKYEIECLILKNVKITL